MSDAENVGSILDAYLILNTALPDYQRGKAAVRSWKLMNKN
jgi:hypothetical protein